MNSEGLEYGSWVWVNTLKFYPRHLSCCGAERPKWDKTVFYVYILYGTFTSYLS